jgi:hypothetical protein
LLTGALHLDASVPVDCVVPFTMFDVPSAHNASLRPWVIAASAPSSTFTTQPCLK